VLPDIRITKRRGIRRSQAMSEVRTIPAGAKRKLPARFHSLLRYFIIIIIIIIYSHKKHAGYIGCLLRNINKCSKSKN